MNRTGDRTWSTVGKRKPDKINIQDECRRRYRQGGTTGSSGGIGGNAEKVWYGVDDLVGTAEEKQISSVYLNMDYLSRGE